MNEVDFYLVDLKSRFDKIKPNTYYLSYSGGKDSHYEWVHCYKCGMIRKDLYSLGHKVEGEWYVKD